MKIKMKKNLLFVILIFLVVQIGFVLAQEEVIFSLDDIDIMGPSDAIEYWDMGETHRITIIGGITDSEKITIGDFVFENILSQNEAGHPTYIELNKVGEIIRADFTVNEKGGTYFLNENEFEVPANSEEPRIIYNKDSKSLELPKGSKLNDMSKDGLLVEGIDLNLFDEIFFDGESSSSVTKEGFMIKKGKAVYEGLEINVDKDSGDVLIVKDSSSDYLGNRIEKFSDSFSDNLIMQSSETGSINVKFLKDNGIIEIGEYGKLNMEIKKGDGIEASRLFGELSKISHKSSETGTTIIQNNGLDFSFKGGDMVFKERDIDVNGILSGEYASVEFIIDSDLEKMVGKELEVFKDGTASLGKWVERYNVNTPELTKKTVSSYSGKIGKFTEKGFEHEDLYKIAESLTKENSVKSANDVFNSRLPNILEGASKNDFSKDQTVNLITKTIDLAGKDSGVAFLYMNRPLSFAEKRLTPNELTIFSLKVTEEALEKGDLTVLNSAYGLLSESLDRNLDLINTLDFTSRAIHLNDDISLKNQELFLKDSLREYNGNNFESIAQGIKVVNKYKLPENIITGFDFDLKYSEIKNKEDLGARYASLTKEYFNGNPDPYYSLILSRGINILHDAEGIEGDVIRETIIANLDTKSKYRLIAHAREDKDLYPSTFGKIKDSFSENFIEELKQIDPQREYVLDFTLQAASRGALNDFVENDAEFFRETIKEALSAETDKKLMENAAFISETFEKYYEDPEYIEEKEDFENFLLERINEKGLSLKEEATFAYLMKLNKNPKDEDFKKKVDTLPKITSTYATKLDDKIKIKAFYMNDEVWFDESDSNYRRDFDYNLLPQGKDPNIKVLERNNGQEIMEMQLLSINDMEESRKQFKAAVEDSTIDIIAFRTHCHHYSKFVDPSYTSESDKIIYFGQCGGARKAPEFLSQFNNANVFYWKEKGEGALNDNALSFISENLLAGETEIKKLTLRGEDYYTFVGPDDAGPALWKYLREYKIWKKG